MVAIGWLRMDISLHQIEVRRELENDRSFSVSEERILELTFTLEETETLLDWEHEREFEYQGQMYDILESHQEGDSITYKVWADHEETRMKGLLSKLIKDGFGEEEDGSTKHLRDFQLFFHLSQKANFSSPIYFKELKSSYSTIFYTSPLLRPTTPPPNQVA